MQLQILFLSVLTIVHPVLCMEGNKSNDNNNNNNTQLAYRHKIENDEIMALLMDAREEATKSLLLAASGNWADVAGAALAAGAGINGRDERGRSALMVAAQHNSKNVLAILLGNGADKNAKDKDGRTILQIAEKYGSHDVADLLSGKGVRNKNNNSSHNKFMVDFKSDCPFMLKIRIEDVHNKTLSRFVTSLAASMLTFNLVTQKNDDPFILLKPKGSFELTLDENYFKQGGVVHVRIVPSLATHESNENNDHEFPYELNIGGSHDGSSFVIEDIWQLGEKFQHMQVK